MKKRKHQSTKHFMGRQLPFILMVLPFFLAFLIFTLIPMLAAVALSFTDYNLLQVNHFVGFDNYIRMLFEDDIFMLSLKNTLMMAIITGPIGFVLSFVIAWLINELGRVTRTIVTFIVYSPALVGNVYFIWKFIFASDSRGFLNNLLMQMGIIADPISWLTDTDYNMAIVILVTVWLSFGTGFLSFVSGLKALDPSYYEAAAVDGLKNRWQELYYVTFPQMGPQLMFGAVMSISSAFAVGAVNAELTGNPSSNYQTHTLVLYMSDFANLRYEMGYACAVAVVLFLLTIFTKQLINLMLKPFMDNGV